MPLNRLQDAFWTSPTWPMGWASTIPIPFFKVISTSPEQRQGQERLTVCPTSPSLATARSKTLNLAPVCHRCSSPELPCQTPPA